MAKTAVLTGYTSGIGQAITTRLKAEGWRVLGVARHLPMDAEGYEADLSNLESVEPLATRLGEDAGTIDAFIHCAGVWHDEDKVLAGLRINEFSTMQIVKTINVGLTSAIILSARLAQFMSDGGSMIVISGAFADGGANWLPYYTSKRALEDFVVALGQETHHFRVYGVSPSDTATDSYKKYFSANVTEAQSPAAVAKVCHDLISNTLGADTGSIVAVKNGQISHGYHS